MKYWLAGQRRPGYERRFEKVSIFMLSDNEDIQFLEILTWTL